MGGCCCVFFLPGFTLATVTVCVKASWRALSVTLELCVARKGKGDFSERTAARSWTTRTNRLLALIRGMVQLWGENWIMSVVCVALVLVMYMV